MLSEENSMNNIFSHNQESFWNIIKDEFSEIIINRDLVKVLRDKF